MLIIPAIDIKGGRCVRLFQGRMEQETVYSDDPVSVAKKWENEGAEMLHLVDLDGAIAGIPKNKEVISSIIKSIKIPAEVGGGIRNIETVKEYISIGVQKVVIGTSACENPEFVRKACNTFPERIMVGIDAKNGNAAVRGWKDVTETSASVLAKRFEGFGISGIIYTDISRDGTLSGPNIDSIKSFAESIDIPVIASGGVSNINDIKNIMKLKKHGVTGVIIGKALYSGSVDLREAIKLVYSENFSE
ncbi:MAG: 1-(5-phosphoribosyl)-5-[(5-phosphoribosylamino)methylideneamino]imidazole-4-carboxamide isomerase [Nitrospinae bacterium RIFCSPLOWO2_02_39_17]|nr:MAG: 1-(5-phosphoribosyl)-5-[(5-phosphoribosylamino)methylideneamino]imidazole-4-carboxamide isomerase [Nitrospinae bacterium RIFCSPHIGHO2_12_FULL_39_42]OGW04481.1 MAG: 1-(5-phosphoribosyl)-5-[(5-phosphoribosylamino)methylideneamino]imidazole-4-carboxamide isomerase [Nitrospinae bacterium RIFCSPLOWO2_02_39_17]OGW07619.1 MAG: 1-(5-phosphoribosyl)-5-[(5-phosphoribosylamino)methylideneamino]imidazole-4-carboxamide isomerase [Nitrospinae bacterium RIFCSPLOWO2_12_39_15]